MVLHVSGSIFPRLVTLLDGPIAFEFGKDRLVRFPHEVRQDVQPAAVGHAEDHFAGTGSGGESPP